MQKSTKPKMPNPPFMQNGGLFHEACYRPDMSRKNQFFCDGYRLVGCAKNEFHLHYVGFFGYLCATAPCMEMDTNKTIMTLVEKKKATSTILQAKHVSALDVY